MPNDGVTRLENKNKLVVMYNKMLSFSIYLCYESKRIIYKSNYDLFPRSSVQFHKKYVNIAKKHIVLRIALVNQYSGCFYKLIKGDAPLLSWQQCYFRNGVSTVYQKCQLLPTVTTVSTLYRCYTTPKLYRWCYMEAFISFLPNIRVYHMCNCVFSFLEV